MQIIKNSSLTDKSYSIRPCFSSKANHQIRFLIISLYSVVVGFWSAPGSRHVFHLFRTLETDDKTCQQITFTSTTQPFPRTSILSRTPPPRKFSLSEHLLEHYSVVPKTTPPAPSETHTSADLIDLHLQFSKQNSLDSQTQLHRQIILRFECCNNPCSCASGYRWQQKSLLIIKSVIRTVMKKSQHANLTVMEIRNFHTVGWERR